ncbi:hypothetical protein COK90_11465 [Priestia megaterium]|uniref:hypothetical protein n=1 Tax=Priestia megaterium TaxID=1404 RepID=UPI000BF87F29|nr:hypothetical protein [Priestia megaterium]PFU61782.1 hypothetical protein COK90_11465 [Priestia megaterium]
MAVNKKNRKSNRNAGQNQERKWRRVEIWFSLIALVISILTICWTIYQDLEKDKEEIIINSFEPSESSKISFSHGLKKNLITLEFGILLSNTSDNTISLIDHRLEQITQFPLQKGFTYPNYYSGIDDGFFEANGTKASMPFVIKSGESKLVYIKTAVITNDNAYKKINNAYKKETGNDLSSAQKLTYGELVYYEVKAATDIYGNKVKGNTIKDSSEEKTYYYSTDTHDPYDTDDPHPTFSLTFKSVKGNYFKEKYNQYKMNPF